MEEENIPSCGICLLSLVDPVSMTCKGQHMYCFSCIFGYYKSKSSVLNRVCCPECRLGNGAIILHTVYGEMLKVWGNNTKDEVNRIEGSVVSSEYFKALPDLKRQFPLVFGDANDNCIITPEQMCLFVNNYELLNKLQLGAEEETEGMNWKNKFGGDMKDRDQNRSIDRFLVASSVSSSTNRNHIPLRRSRANATSELPMYIPNLSVPSFSFPTLRDENSALNFGEDLEFREDKWLYVCAHIYRSRDPQFVYIRFSQGRHSLDVFRHHRELEFDVVFKFRLSVGFNSTTNITDGEFDEYCDRSVFQQELSEIPIGQKRKMKGIMCAVQQLLRMGRV